MSKPSSRTGIKVDVETAYLPDQSDSSFVVRITDGLQKETMLRAS